MPEFHDAIDVVEEALLERGLVQPCLRGDRDAQRSKGCNVLETIARDSPQDLSIVRLGSVRNCGCRVTIIASFIHRLWWR